MGWKIRRNTAQLTCEILFDGVLNIYVVVNTTRMCHLKMSSYLLHWEPEFSLRHFFSFVSLVRRFLCNFVMKVLSKMCQCVLHFWLKSYSNNDRVTRRHAFLCASRPCLSRCTAGKNVSNKRYKEEETHISFAYFCLSFFLLNQGQQNHQN
jgi:hypothetical protein